MVSDEPVGIDQDEDGAPCNKTKHFLPYSLQVLCDIGYERNAALCSPMFQGDPRYLLFQVPVLCQQHGHPGCPETELLSIKSQAQTKVFLFYTPSHHDARCLMPHNKRPPAGLLVGQHASHVLVNVTNVLCNTKPNKGPYKTYT